jgi:hypothetical protein
LPPCSKVSDSAWLDGFVAAGVAVEVTHRSKRRLFGLAGLAPLRTVVRPPYRPDPRARPSAARPTRRPGQVAARSAITGRRRDSHAVTAVDVLAAMPLVSATSLAAGLGLAVKTAIRLRAPRVPNGLIRLRHPVVEVAVVELPAIALSTLAQPARMDAGLSNEPLDACVAALSLDIPADPNHRSEQPAPVPE